MTEDEQVFVKITPQQIYAVAIETRDSVRSLDSSIAEAVKDIGDHESRLRSMERKVWGFSGLAGIVSSVLTLFVSNGGKI